MDVVSPLVVVVRVDVSKVVTEEDVDEAAVVVTIKAVTEQVEQFQHAWSLQRTVPPDAEKPAAWRELPMKEHWYEVREES